MSLAPIIICGMAHTGTTALARYLGSARGWRNYTSGPETHLLECDELLQRAAAPLQAAIENEPKTRLVLKRPWLEEDWEWCLDHFPDAAYLVCVRDFTSTWTSWNKPHSAGLDRGLVNCSPEHAWEVWSRYSRFGAALVAHAKCGAFVDHGAFCRRPQLVDQTLRGWGILGKRQRPPFDPSTVQAWRG